MRRGPGWRGAASWDNSRSVAGRYRSADCPDPQRVNCKVGVAFYAARPGLAGCRELGQLAQIFKQTGQFGV